MPADLSKSAKWGEFLLADISKYAGVVFFSKSTVVDLRKAANCGVNFCQMISVNLQW